MLKDVPANLDNSMKLIENTQSRDRATNQKCPYSLSLNVVSLYTSIPIQEAINKVTDRIKNTIFSLTAEDLQELHTIALKVSMK